MCDIKWIKISTDIFDDEKILLIESLPEADSILVIWFKMLTLAGKMNNDGKFAMANGLAYNEKMLATIFRQKEATISLALQTFEQFGMIDRADGVIKLANWSKHQSIVKRNDYMREYMRDYRAKQLAEPKEEAVVNNVNTDVNANKVNNVNNVSGVVKDKNKEERIKNKNKENIDYMSFVEQYNKICVSLPKVQSITQARKSAIRARISEYPVQVILEVFNRAENSDFLSGRKGNWRANFDWLMKPANFAKVLEGNYNDKKQVAQMDDLDGLF